MSSNSITELANALREAANQIEKAARFKFSEDVDIAEAVSLVQAMKPKSEEATIIISIMVPANKRDEITVEYRIDESYHNRAKANSFAALLESYTASKEGKDSVKSLERMVKKACLQVDPKKLTAAIASVDEVA
jgi:hypothetical protein